MKKIKFDGTRYWLYLDYSSKWAPFTESCLDILVPLIKKKYGTIDSGAIYEIEDPKDRIYGANHGPMPGGKVCSGAYPMDHHECAGTGIMATFSHSWGWE